MARYRVGVDIGGTFTDFAIHDTQRGHLFGFKTPTVPVSPVSGVATGLQHLQEAFRVSPQEIGYFVHGTTIGVNALIERKGARLGLLVTRGFRDILIIQRLRIPDPQNWYGFRPKPLVPRERVYEIDERLMADGSVRVPLAADGLRAAVQGARAQRVEGLVVCFLHAFRNPEHERAAREFLSREAPDLFVCCSHEVWPQMREYERATLTLINAYVMPPVRRYLEALERHLTDQRVPAKPYITRSNGGIMTARRARVATAETLLSGPASGVIGALRVASQADIQDLITLDVGGTSADVAIVEQGSPRTSLTEHVADFPIMMPVVGVSSIGAGGGSIAWLDGAGVLKVGPQSAGADPGPACYGKGNEQPTLSDAFLASGLLNPATFGGGRIPLYADRAEAALNTLSEGLDADAAGVAGAILAMAVAGMHAEFTNLTARRGIDAREFTLVAFGGAGALLACRLAEEVGMTQVLIPQAPGTLCALGALSADVATDLVRSLVLRLDEDLSPVVAAYHQLEQEAVDWLRDEAPFLEQHTLLLSADMRYVGQSYEVDVPLEPDHLLTGDIKALASAFYDAHQRVYSHADRTAPVELIDLRLRIVGVTQRPPLPTLVEASFAATAAAAEHRKTWLRGGAISTPVYRREDLLAGHLLAGPALVDQSDTTVLVEAGWSGIVHPSGSLLLRRDT